jgi:polyisoprenoid-binding protein YceI
MKRAIRAAGVAAAELMLEAPGNPQAGMDSKVARRGFAATTKTNRKDFGLKLKSGGDGTIADEVKIKLQIEAVRQ